MADSLTELYDALRRTRPRVFDADRWLPWVDAMAPVVQAMPGKTHRWAAVVLLANDLHREMPPLSIAHAFEYLAPRLLLDESRREVLR